MKSDFDEHITFEGMKIAEIFFKAVDGNPEKTAVWCDGKVINYRELGALVCKYANYLQAHGVEYGDHIGIPMNNSIESVALIMTVAVIGAGLVPINSSLPVDAVDNAFKAGSVKHLIARRAFFRTIEKHDFSYLTGCRLCLDGNAEGADSFDAVLQASDARLSLTGITGNETLILTMTSGSTGVPKPIELTQRNKLDRAVAHINLYDIKPTDKILAATPLYHSLAERLVIMPLLIGGTSILLPRFTPALWLKCVEEQQVTFTIAVSAQLSQIVPLLNGLQTPNISSLRTVVSSSALLEPNVRNELIKKLHCDFHEMYGTSECSTVTSINFRESEEKQKSVGRPLPGVKICIVDDKGNVVPSETIGEITVKTPLQCNGYYRLPRKTEEAFLGSFFRTGDLGCFDSDGYLYFAGRKKDLIITGGVNVYPQDVEDKVLSIDAVKECAAFPFVDERLGEVVALAIVVKKGKQLSRKEVKFFCARNLADFQQPHKVFFISELPRNAMGKVTKMKLPEIVANMEG